MEAFLLVDQEASGFPRTPFVLTSIALFLCLCLLEYTFRLFVPGRAAVLFPLLPAALLFLLVRKAAPDSFLTAAVLTAAAGRLLFSLLPRRSKILPPSVFILDAAAVFLFVDKKILLGSFYTDRLLFVSLAVLTLAAVQEFTAPSGRTGQKDAEAKSGRAFPFLFFLLLGGILTAIPMDQKPIDWSPLVMTGERLVRRIRDSADEASYFMSSFWEGDSYTTGYSSLGVTGGKIEHSGRTQVLLEMSEKPYYEYVDGNSGQKMRMRRTIYLSGGRGPSNERLIGFLKLLDDSGADREYAALFSRISEISVEYAFLKTADEIAPVNTIQLSVEAPGSGDLSSGVHQKGYRIRARYLDIDYGSPYLIRLLREAESNALKSGKADDSFSYESAGICFKELYGAELGDILTKEEYYAILQRDKQNTEDALDVTGATDRMRALAAELTAGVSSGYDRCKKIEAYLRQYRYDTNAVGGHDPDLDPGSPQGMADLADRFLFETGSGYCVHYTASMVMLLRLAGIPARALTGYRYSFPFEQEDLYVVSGDYAHMWPEAHLNGAGWICLEPTSTYRTAADYSWHRKPASQAAENYSAVTDSEMIPLPETADISPESLEEDDSWSGRVPGFVRIALAVALSTALLFAVLIIAASAAEKLRYRFGSPQTKLSMDVAMIKKAIRKRSLEAFPDRGLLSDYTAHAPEEIRQDVQKVFSTYYRVVYSGAGSGVSPEENLLAETVRKTLNDLYYYVFSG